MSRYCHNCPDKMACATFGYCVNAEDGSAKERSRHLQELRGDPTWFDSHPMVIEQRAGPQTMGEWWSELWEDEA